MNRNKPESLSSIVSCFVRVMTSRTAQYIEIISEFENNLACLFFAIELYLCIATISAGILWPALCIL